MNRLKLFFVVLGAFACAYALSLTSTRTHLLERLDLKATVPGGDTPPASRALRPNYPYSVIPGGAYSPAELESTVKRDSLVRDHYSDFDLKATRLVTLTEDRLQYVSYRLKNRVYWTRDRLRIPRGEVLLTDGVNFARTRCGNRLSSQPKTQTNRNEVSNKLLSLPTFTPAMLQMSQVELAPPAIDVSQNPTPLLTVDSSRLAPYLPEETVVNATDAQPLWPSLVSYSPTSGIVASGLPPGLANLPSPPSSPLPSSLLPTTPTSTTPPLPAALTPPGSEVPEPGSTTLLMISFAGWIWLLTRVMRTGKRSMR